MKLFQHLLVAGASLSLLTPIVAQASDINIEEMSSYSRSKKKSSRLDSKTFTNDFGEKVVNLKGLVKGLEVQENNFEAGSFSDTTTLDSSVVFAATAIDGAEKVNADAADTLQAMYTYTMNLNTSFTGDDNLYVRLRTGNGKVVDVPSGLGTLDGSFYEKTAFYHTDTYSGGVDTLKVDKLWYTTPIGSSEKWTATIGPKIENYYMYAAPVSIYRPGFHKAFKLGSLSGAFGASTATGGGIKYVGDNGFAFSSNLVSKGASSAGLLTNEDEHKWDTMLAYTKDQYHVSLSWSQQHEDWSSFSYYATDAAASVEEDSNATAYAARAYWRPQESGTATPEISVGFDTIALDGQTGNSVKEASSYFVGLGWPDMFQDSDYIGIGFGQPLKVTETADGTAADDEGLNPFLWEASYSFKVNDSVTMIPAIFGGADIQSATNQDIFGAALTTKFKF